MVAGSRYCQLHVHTLEQGKLWMLEVVCLKLVLVIAVVVELFVVVYLFSSVLLCCVVF